MRELTPDFSLAAISSLLDGMKQLPEDPSCVIRLFHGRGRTFPGLDQVCVDYLGGQLLIALFKEPPAEWLEAFQQALEKELNQSNWLTGQNIQSLLLQHRSRPGSPTELIWGALKSPWVVDENGLKFGLTLGRNQNHGLFLDMANGRKWVRDNARHKRVLNLFAYTCGFSVAAIAGGADHVVNLDMARGALAQGRENHKLNQHNLNQVTFLGHELFRSWGKVKRLGPYEVVIIDPPSFQKGSFAIKDYPKILRRLPELVNEGGEVLACVNDPAQPPEVLIEQMAELAPEFRFVERLENPESFPELEPERSLKVMRFVKESKADAQ
ncbi:class I SAM-dependent methyltransferase [Dongshaea marina]|uniref:class I SAM-dependent methyltransferase n=1 Tax=Dongshaea marina TaxID=2047966 RepID=UPI001F194AF3|nr:class I SAM-dependent methyltransferase [Dongshaea marina]